jgi:hypothetical protein
MWVTGGAVLAVGVAKSACWAMSNSVALILLKRDMAMIHLGSNTAATCAVTPVLLHHIKN